MLNLRNNSTRYTGSVKKERTERFTLRIGVLLVVIMFVGIAAVVSRRVIGVLGTPLLRTRSVLSDMELLTISRDELVARVRELQTKNQELQSRLLAAAVLEQENATLRDLLDVGESDEVYSVVASILVRPPETPYGYLVVDRGSRAGIAVGDIARVGSGEVLGEISSVSEDTAFVSLYTAPDVEYDVLLGPEYSPVIAYGLSGSWRIEVPQAFEVAVGDTLIDPSSERHLLGVVVSIDEREGEPFKHVFAAPSTNLYELSWVHIVRLE